MMPIKTKHLGEKIGWWGTREEGNYCILKPDTDIHGLSIQAKLNSQD